MISVEAFLGLLLAAILIALIAKRLDQPFPIVLVLGGIGLAMIPGIPKLSISPEMVFFVLLPPILTEAACFTSWRDLLRARRPILMLAVGLVVATSTLVAVLCVQFIPGMTWATGFLLGAIVSPPDAAAAASIVRGMGLPKRVVQIIEGESLVNDAAGLMLYRFAVAVVVGGSFTWQGAAIGFVWIVLGGVGVGVALGYAYVKLFRFLRDPEVEVLSTFLLSYLSYFIAESMHSSGVLATVASGLILGWHAPELFTANGRIRGMAVWQTVVFLINATMFLLIGLQIPAVIEGLNGYPAGMLIWWSLIVLGGVMAIRMAWVFPGAYLPRLLFKSIRETESRPDWRGVAVIGWTGLRGVVSLAGALALPLETERGLPFPYRNLILLLTFAVIVGTLFIQGLSLRAVVRLLGLPKDRSSEEEQLNARIYVAEKVIERLMEMEKQGKCTGAMFDRVSGYYGDRIADLRARLEVERGEEQVGSPQSFQSVGEQRLWWVLAEVERDALLEMRRNLKIGDDVMHEIERDIDLLESRIVPKK